MKQTVPAHRRSLTPTRGRLVAALLAGAILAGRAAPAAARRGSSSDTSGVVLDISNGVSIPLGDDDYKRYVDPSYKFELRVGYEIHLVGPLGFAPELGFDAVAVNSSDRTFQSNNIDARFVRVRFMGGGRLMLHFGALGYFFVRTLFGVDYSSGSLGITGSNLSTDTSSVGFAFAPEIGVAFRVYRFLHVGLTVGFPVGTFDFNKSFGNAVNVRSSFTGVDLDLLATLGFHF